MPAQVRPARGLRAWHRAHITQGAGPEVFRPRAAHREKVEGRVIIGHGSRSVGVNDGEHLSRISNIRGLALLPDEDLLDAVRAGVHFSRAYLHNVTQLDARLYKPWVKGYRRD